MCRIREYNSDVQQFSCPYWGQPSPFHCYSTAWRTLHGSLLFILNKTVVSLSILGMIRFPNKRPSLAHLVPVSMGNTENQKED